MWFENGGAWSGIEAARDVQIGGSHRVRAFAIAEVAAGPREVLRARSVARVILGEVGPARHICDIERCACFRREAASAP